MNITKPADLTVTITGGDKSGKHTIARALARLLAHEGLWVRMQGGQADAEVTFQDLRKQEVAVQINAQDAPQSVPVAIVEVPQPMSGKRLRAFQKTWDEQALKGTIRARRKRGETQAQADERTRLGREHAAEHRKRIGRNVGEPVPAPTLTRKKPVWTPKMRAAARARTQAYWASKKAKRRAKK